MKQTEGMSRQAKRQFNRKAAKTIGQIKAIESEFEKPIRVAKAKAHFKNLKRLHGDLQLMGLVKPPGRWQRILGRTKATFQSLGKIIRFWMPEILEIGFKKAI